MSKIRLLEKLDLEQLEDLDIETFVKIRKKNTKDEEREKKEERSQKARQVV